MCKISDTFKNLGDKHVERMLRVLRLSYHAPLHQHLGHLDFVAKETDLMLEEVIIVVRDLRDLGYIKQKTNRITEDGFQVLITMGFSYIETNDKTKGF